MPRDTRLTLWPEQMAYYPLSNSWAEIKNTSILDFSHCLGVHSCGLAATVLNLHWLFNYLISSKITSNKNEPPQKQTNLFSIKQIDCPATKPKGKIPSGLLISKIIKHQDDQLMLACKDLGFFDCIKNCLTDSLRDSYCKDNYFQEITTEYFSLNTLSYPIHHIDFTPYPDDRRNILDPFFNYIQPILDNIVFTKNPNRCSQFIHVLEEIVQNIADHASADGFMGLDIIYSSNKITTCILIGDLGPGIYKHIKEVFIDTQENRRKKGSLAEAYKLALSNEVSAGVSSLNRGCGMSCIINNCIGMGTHLSVFDLESRIILSSLPVIDQDPPSHNALWRNSFRFSRKKPFFYYLVHEEHI